MRDEVAPISVDVDEARGSRTHAYHEVDPEDDSATHAS